MPGKNKGLKPGQAAPESGQYAVVNRAGNRTGHEVTAIEGKTLPPQPVKGRTYDLVDETKHKK